MLCLFRVKEIKVVVQISVLALTGYYCLFFCVSVQQVTAFETLCFTFITDRIYLYEGLMIVLPTVL